MRLSDGLGLHAWAEAGPLLLTDSHLPAPPSLRRWRTSHPLGHPVHELYYLPATLTQVVADLTPENARVLWASKTLEVCCGWSNCLCAAGLAAPSVGTCVWHSCRSGVMLVCYGPPRRSRCGPAHLLAMHSIVMQLVLSEWPLRQRAGCRRCSVCHTRAGHHYTTSPFTPLPALQPECTETESWYSTKYAAGPLPADWLQVGATAERGACCRGASVRCRSWLAAVVIARAISTQVAGWCSACRAESPAAHLIQAASCLCTIPPTCTGVEERGGAARAAPARPEPVHPIRLWAAGGGFRSRFSWIGVWAGTDGCWYCWVLQGPSLHACPLMLACGMWACCALLQCWLWAPGAGPHSLPSVVACRTAAWPRIALHAMCQALANAASCTRCCRTVLVHHDGQALVCFPAGWGGAACAAARRRHGAAVAQAGPTVQGAQGGAVSAPAAARQVAVV